MRKIIFALVLLLSGGVQAGALVPGNAPSLTVGGRVFTDTTNLIILTCYTAGANSYSTCRKGNSTSGYQVPAGKTFTILAVKSISGNSSWNLVSIGYADNDVGVNVNTTPTNSVFFGGASGVFVTGSQSGIDLQTASQSSVYFAVPSLKYTFINVTNSTAFIYGYEQ